MKLLFIASCLFIGSFAFADQKSAVVTSAEDLIKQAREMLLHHPNSRYESSIKNVIAEIERRIKIVEQETDPIKRREEEGNLLGQERSLAKLLAVAGRDNGPQTERPPPTTAKH